MKKVKKEEVCPVCKGTGRSKNGQWLCPSCKGSGQQTSDIILRKKLWSLEYWLTPTIIQ